MRCATIAPMDHDLLLRDLLDCSGRHYHRAVAQAQQRLMEQYHRLYRQLVAETADLAPLVRARKLREQHAMLRVHTRTLLDHEIRRLQAEQCVRETRLFEWWANRTTHPADSAW